MYTEVSAICHIYTTLLTDTKKFSFSENFRMYGKISQMVKFRKLPYIRKFLPSVTFTQQIHKSSVSVKTSVCTVVSEKCLCLPKFTVHTEVTLTNVQFLFILSLLLTLLTNCYFILSGGAVMFVPSLTINMWALTRMRARTGIIDLYTSFRSSVV